MNNAMGNSGPMYSVYMTSEISQLELSLSGPMILKKCNGASIAQNLAAAPVRV